MEDIDNCIICGNTVSMQRFLYFNADRTFARRGLCQAHRVLYHGTAERLSPDDPYRTRAQIVFEEQHSRFKDLVAHGSAWPSLVQWCDQNPA